MQSPNHADDGRPPFPASAQVALALIVLRSKPPDATVEEHLNLLRARFKSGSAATRNSATQHPDGAAYWKQAYERAEEEKAALLDRLYDLEKHIAMPMVLTSPVARSPLAKDRKRKREDTAVAKANSRSKRRANPSKITESPPKASELTGGSNLLLTNDVYTGHTKLLQAFFALRINLRSQKADLSTILSRARRLCHTIREIVKGVGDTAESMDPCEADTDLWEALRRILGSILEAMDILCIEVTPSSGTSALISDLAKVLSEMMKCLRTLASREQPEKMGVRTRKQPLDDSRRPTTELSKVIASMMTSLDLHKEWQRELFEALAYVFFDHIGSRLSKAVFSESTTLGKPFTIGLLQPRGLPTKQEGDTPSDLATTLREAPHLVTILRTISSFSNGKDGGRADLLWSTNLCQKDGYAAGIITKMQNTMLQGIFGDQEAAFCDTLQRPSEAESSDGTENMAADEEEDLTCEWFVGQVWKHIGWDILTKSIV